MLDTAPPKNGSTGGNGPNGPPEPDRPTDPPETNQRARQRWMGVLARADGAALETLWRDYLRTSALPTGQDGPQKTSPEVPYDLLRAPECGLVMIQGRAGGTGAPFNMGETTVTRCSVQLPGGTVGHGYVAGRDKRHAELAALIDALLQTPEAHDAIMAEVITPLEAAFVAARQKRARKTAATKVDFFTLARGEDT